MKFSLLTVVATLAVASADNCDLTKITTLLTNPNVATCTADSGFSFTALAAPTAETLPKLCASTACKTVLTAVKALGLGDCTLLGMRLETDLITPIQTACAKSSGSSNSTSASNSTSTSAGSSAGSKSGTATVGSTTAPTTKKPSTSGSGGSASTVSTPAPSTTAKSSASSVAMATGAVVVAIAAAFL
ncbi:Elicitin-like protein [Globisporangium polare]